jgi:hypothetical protein
MHGHDVGFEQKLQSASHKPKYHVTNLNMVSYILKDYIKLHKSY